MSGRNLIGRVAAVALLAGCARLPAGRTDPLPAGPTVYLVRGFLDWYSDGIDRLAAELAADGNRTAVFGDDQAADLAAALLHHRGPIVLVGFSYGADDVIDIARRLRQPIDLLVTIDPVTPSAIPSDVRRAVNFYQPNGIWDLLPFLRGVPVDGATNIDVRARPDLIEPDTSHATIAANPKVHRAIVDLIRQARRL